MLRWEGTEWLVLLRNAFNQLLVVLGLLCALWGDSSLVVEFWSHVLEWLSSVVFLSCLLEIPFYHIQVFFVVFVLDSWVLEKEDSELMEGLSHLAALFLVLAWSLVEIGLDINDWNVFKFANVLHVFV